MNLDSNGLPVQADGDANDQLQRVGMILTAYELRKLSSDALDEACCEGLYKLLQPSPGIYVRHYGGDPANVSADQLISALAAHVTLKNRGEIWAMIKSMVKRGGFAQNTKDGLNANSKWKLPDFMLLRAAPLFARMHPLLYPLAVLADILLIGLTLAAVGPVFKDNSCLPSRRGPDDVDHNNTILTLAVCSHRMPTPFSWLARKLFTKLCPWNYGCVRKFIVPPPVCMIESISDNNAYHPVYGSLRWYHRAEAGGNPEIAELWKPICERYFE